MLKPIVFKITFLSMIFSSTVFASPLNCNQDVTLDSLNKIADFKYEVFDVKSQKTRPGKTLKINDELKSKWHLPSNDVKSITVLVHGLNYRSNYMDNVVSLFTNAGSMVLNVSMPGYREVLDPKTKMAKIDFELQPVTLFGFGIGHKIVDRLEAHPEHHHSLEIFNQHLMKAYCIAKKEADKNNVKVNFAGFSMGGALLTSLFNNPKLETELEVSKMVLLSPGFIGANLIKPGLLLTDIIPNARFFMGEGEYNYEGTTEGRKFLALMQANQVLQENGFNKANIPTLIFANLKDEMVSLDYIEELIDTELSNWKISPVDTDLGSEHGKKMHHIITFKDYVGTKTWLSMQDQILELFNN